MIAKIDFNVNDTQLAGLEAFIDRCEGILDAPREPWTLDCSRCQYLGPAAAVVLASMWMQEGRHDDSSIQLPSSPPPLASFCTYSGLQHLVSNAAPPDPRHPMNETAPLHSFSRMDWGMTTPFVELVQRHAPSVGGEEHSVLRLCVEEIAQNIEDHALSPIGGLSCARFLKGSNEIRLSLLDRGLGIPETLRRSGHDFNSDAEALQKVVEGNVSAKSRPNNMGQGISNLAMIARGHSGHLIIVSGTACIHVRHDREDPVAKSRRSFPGTLVVMSLVLDADTSEDESE